ncbi:MAG: thymidine phosphorylase [Elusimicrobiota bacterium]
MRMIDIIIKKRDNLPLSKEELNFIAQSAAQGSVPDYQLSSWLMAVYFNGLSAQETAFLTKAMADSGDRLNLSCIKGLKIDKHSTGGVGDGPSLALAPIAAAAGVAVPMMSGRGLGHTGGTLDKLEAIKGFKVRLDISHIIKQMKALGVCMFGQTGRLAPSDKKLYALRDVTGTVESIPLIVASILSKKYAEGINGLVMDVKFGHGAFMQDYSKAKRLALALIDTASLLNIKAAAMLTDMNNPLGRAIGNGIETEQAVRMLHGEKQAEDYEELTYALSGYMIYMAGKAETYPQGIEKAMKAVKDKSALNKMREMVKWQGGDVKAVDNPSVFLPRAKFVKEIKSMREGWISEMNARTVGKACIAIGVGRTKAEDSVDFKAGFWLNKKAGDFVKKGEVIAYMYCSDPDKIKEGTSLFYSSLSFSKIKPKRQRLISEIIAPKKK